MNEALDYGTASYSDTSRVGFALDGRGKRVGAGIDSITPMEALNTAQLSLEEYRWIREQAYRALGQAFVDLDIGKLVEDVKRGVSPELYDVRPYDIIYVPRSAIGDFDAFGDSVLSHLVNFSRLFWDVYAIVNIDKIERVVR